MIKATEQFAERVSALSSRPVVLPVDNVDTDQIIPARFLKTTDRTGLGHALFADWRYDTSGAPRPEFVLNRPESSGAEILVAGRNFGCGSSREHAPWALRAYGFRAVISTDFADIFRMNALKNGLLPVAVDPAAHGQLLRMLKHEPAQVLTIDLLAQTLTFGNGRSATFPIDPFARHCLLHGVDELGLLLAEGAAIRAYEFAHEERRSNGSSACAR